MSLQDEEIGSVMMKVENVGRNLGRRKNGGQETWYPDRETRSRSC